MKYMIQLKVCRNAMFDAFIYELYETIETA